MTKLEVKVYAKKNCTLCNEAVKIIGRVNEEVPFDYTEVDISECEDLSRRFSKDIPTVFVNGKKAFKFKVDEGEFRKMVRKELIKAGMSRLSSRKQHHS